MPIRSAECSAIGPAPFTREQTVVAQTDPKTWRIAPHISATPPVEGGGEVCDKPVLASRLDFHHMEMWDVFAVLSRLFPRLIRVAENVRMTFGAVPGACDFGDNADAVIDPPVAVVVDTVAVLSGTDTAIREFTGIRDFVGVWKFKGVRSLEGIGDLDYVHFWEDIGGGGSSVDRECVHAACIQIGTTFEKEAAAAHHKRASSSDQCGVLSRDGNQQVLQGVAPG